MIGNCEICHRYGTLERHHVFEGVGRRQASEEYGCVVNICRACHSAIHARPSEYIWLKREAQETVMERENWIAQDFINKFGKSYI